MLGLTVVFLFLAFRVDIQGGAPRGVRFRDLGCWGCGLRV